MQRHSYNIITGLLLSLLAIVFLASCSSSSDDRSYRIAVSQPSGDDWRQTMNDEIRREEMFHPGVSVEILSAENDNEKQKADLRYFIDEGVDLIIVSPNEPDPLAPLVREARQKGIEVISFDRRIEGGNCTMHVEVDNEALGREVADYALSLFPHGARILEIEGNLHTSPATGRHKGFADGIAAHPDMQIVESLDAGWRLERAKELADSFLRQRPDIDLVYAHSDGMAIQAAAAAKELGRTGIKYLGIDGIMNVGIKAVTDSVLTATFLYPTYGYLLLRQAIDVLDGKPYEHELILPPVSAVDLRNADILRQQVEMQYEETDKIIKLRDKLSDFLSQYATQQMLLWAAFLLVLFGVVIVVVLVRTLRHDRQHQRVLTEKNEQLELEKRKQEVLYDQLAEATQAKLMFFTNVSHDLRTPLTLIAEPVAQMIEADNLTEQQSLLMTIANKNIHILRRLIDQILDFRKYENGKERLRLSEVDAYALMKEWAEAFEVIAQKRGTEYDVRIPASEGNTLALDTEKMERVVFNIISNAFKYTPDDGTIVVEAHHTEEMFVFSVSDNGRGISQQDREHIFDRFYQVERSTPGGSGIGLALTKAFVEMHGGIIAVESEPGKGSRFTVSIPASHTDEVQEHAGHSFTEETILLELDSSSSSSLLPPPSSLSMPDDDLPLLLVIDDNADILRLIKVLLGHEYNIVTASNGKEGVEMATKYVPDVILCDVMMPVMDGLKCCRMLKQNIATSHIPVLMLTACSLDEQRVEGYDSGADGYMPKPFSAAVLRSRLRNLLENRKRLEAIPTPLTPRARLEETLAPARTGGTDTSSGNAASKTGHSTPPAQGAEGGGIASLPLGKMDSQFYNRVLEILSEEYRNPDLSIEQIASCVGLSQSQFTRKVKALTNYTPVELIKRIRVEEGHRLLMTTDSSISEIAYSVGFSDPNYFTKCHKQIYDETPSELRQKLKYKG